MTEDKTTAAATPAKTPAPVAAPGMAPLVLSQAPPLSPSDAKQVVDKPSTIIAPTLADKK